MREELALRSAVDRSIIGIGGATSEGCVSRIVDDDSVIVQCAARGDVAGIRHAIANGEIRQQQLDNALICATWWGPEHAVFDCVYELTKAGADVEANPDGDSRRIPLLHQAIRRNLRGVAELLLCCGADVNRRDGWGITTLRLAIETCDRKLVEMLLLRGVDMMDGALTIEDSKLSCLSRIPKAVDNGTFETLVNEARRRHINVPESFVEMVVRSASDLKSEVAARVEAAARRDTECGGNSKGR